MDYMRQCVTLAYKCKSAPTAYNVGAVLVAVGSKEDAAAQAQVLATGFSREMPGNTHAEECCLLKLDQKTGYSKQQQPPPPQQTLLEYAKQQLGLPPDTTFTMYTSMEPCSLRTSGKKSCSTRLLEARIDRVVVGAMEPDLFVEACQGVTDLKAQGIAVHVMHGLEQACLAPNLHLVADDQEGDIERLTKRHVLLQVADEVDDTVYGEKPVDTASSNNQDDADEVVHAAKPVKRQSTFPLTVAARRSMEAVKSIFGTSGNAEEGTRQTKSRDGEENKRKSWIMFWKK